jgi:type IV pilus assembly protein PilM
MKKILSKLFNDNKNIIGLDIGLSMIKIMELSGTDLESVRLENYACVPVPPEYLNENGAFNPENVKLISELVNKCWKKAGCTSKHVAVCIKGNNVITKKAILPNFTLQDELKLAVEAELTQYIPEDLNIEDLAIDYFNLGMNELNPNENDMLLIASKKEKIDEIQAIVEGAGLIPEILDVEPFAIQNILKLMKGEEYENKTFVVADCSASMLRMFVFVKGILAATKEVQIGGINLTNDLINNLGISFENAEKMKLDRNGDETFDLIEKSFINNYTTEFISLLSYFSSAMSLGEIDEIILTGGVASIPFLEQSITTGLLDNSDIVVNSEPHIARPLENAGKSPKVNMVKFSSEESGLFLVTSLALRKYLRQF